MTTPIEQLRANRRHALNAWLVGNTPDGSPRWAGDDGRVLYMDEYAFWPAAIQTAEAAKFAELDAEYEAAKAALAQ